MDYCTYLVALNYSTIYNRRCKTLAYIEYIIHLPSLDYTEIKKYLLNGKNHNIRGPALIIYDYNGYIHKKEYMINGILHNNKGPARVLYTNPDVIYCNQYFLNGVKISNITQIDL